MYTGCHFFVEAVIIIISSSSSIIIIIILLKTEIAFYTTVSNLTNLLACQLACKSVQKRILKTLKT